MIKINKERLEKEILSLVRTTMLMAPMMMLCSGGDDKEKTVQKMDAVAKTVTDDIMDKILKEIKKAEQK